MRRWGTTTAGVRLGQDDSVRPPSPRHPTVQVLASSPLLLFNISASITRYDVVWDVEVGQLDLTIYITNTTAGQTFK